MDERARLIRVVDALHDCERGCEAMTRTLAEVAEPDAPADSISDLLFHTSSLMSRFRYESDYLGKSL